MNRRAAAVAWLLFTSAVCCTPAELGAAIQASTAGRAYDELTPEQKRVVDGGGQVFVSRNVEGAPWPAVVVYQYIAAAPDAAAAVFIDYELHRTYIPSVKRSHVSVVVDPATVEVDYVLSIPVVSDERYTVRNRLGSYDGGESYRVDWTLVRASSTKATIGHVRFEPHAGASPGEHGTLMAYSNFVTPGSRLARLGIVERKAMRQVRETASAIARRVESERTTNPARLERQISALRTALQP